MTASLRRRLQRELAQAASWEPGKDPAPVIEALGYASLVDAIGARDLLGRDEAKSLRRAGSEALLAFGPGAGSIGKDEDAEDAEDLAIARRRIAEIARAGLASLDRGSSAPRARGKSQLNLWHAHLFVDSVTELRPPQWKTGTADQIAARTVPAALHPPSRTLVRMLNGDVDGLTAGHWAMHIKECASCQNEIAVVRMTAGETGDIGALAIAAARPASVRAPAGGRVVGEKKRPALEAVLFEDDAGRKLAVYAQASAPVRLVAEGVTTEDTLDGYWIGRVEPDANEVRAQVYVGDEVVEWVIDLEGEKTPR